MNVIVCAIFAVFLTLGTVQPAGAMGSLKGDKGASREAALNKPAPDFSLPDLRGETVRLSDLKGQVVLVNFWASWCPPCVMEIPSLSRFAEAYRAKGVVVLAVNVENKPSAELQAFLAQHPHAFTTLRDSRRQTQSVYGVRQLPETFLVNQEGIIVKRYIGARDWMASDVTQTVDFLLGG